METAGYSGTPLAKKLGYKNGFKARIINAPAYYMKLFNDMPSNVVFTNDNKVRKNLIHYFCTQIKQLENDIIDLKNEIEPNGMIWVSWPKKSARVATDVTENPIRYMALANGLVDIKVCAVDDTWSGLKLVIPVKYRTALIMI